MEIQIKKAVKAGNSSAVILPKSWLNKEVRIELLEKTPEIILLDVINIMKSHIDSSEIIGIYLVGSYAREEEDENSDIDILVVTRDTDKKIIHEGIYSIFIISSELIEQKMKKDLLPIGPMLKEAKPLLNSDYLSSIEVKITRQNVKWYLDTTKDKLETIKRLISETKDKNLSDRVAYTLVLRIRTLYIIDKLIKNENYSKKDFIKIITNVSKGTNAYERYISVKNNSKEGHGISVLEAEKLYEYLKKELTSIKIS